MSRLRRRRRHPNPAPALRAASSKETAGRRVHLDLAVSLLGKKTATESHGDRSVCLRHAPAWRARPRAPLDRTTPVRKVSFVSVDPNGRRSRRRRSHTTAVRLVDRAAASRRSAANVRTAGQPRVAPMTSARRAGFTEHVGRLFVSHRERVSIDLESFCRTAFVETVRATLDAAVTRSGSH